MAFAKSTFVLVDQVDNMWQVSDVIAERIVRVLVQELLLGSTIKKLLILR